MKMTNMLRDSFLIAAMQDVPSEDFGEQRSKLLQADALSKLPSKVRALYEDKELRSFLGTKYVKGCCVYAASDYEPSGAVLKKLRALETKQRVQYERHAALRSKLRSITYAHSTRKALAEALPEFVKYLPAEGPVANRQLPVVANVVADFVKAGWPKDKKLAAKKKSTASSA